jgi:signal transduction histidine kinase
VYFCCVEAIHNSDKHAGATLLRLELARVGDAVEFVVADDGVGFDVDADREGTGLTNMHDRLGAVGGELSVRSTPGAGSEVRGRIPVLPTERPEPTGRT